MVFFIFAQKMLSILIPIYNYNVSNLVKELHKQATKLKINFEILLVDDFSKKYKEENRKLKDLQNIKYEELNENFGRAKIRNYLAKKAKYENLLFLDCDAKIIKNNFIEKYIENKDKQVVCGGTSYSSQKPEEDYLLHWTYGHKREILPIEKRKKSPYAGFKTFNFFIKRNIFEKIKFDEKIKTYGHEDTIFGNKLKQNKIFIQHIDNPAEHIGLEKNDIFIKKMLNSVSNLHKLYQLYQTEKEIFNNIKLMKYFFYLKKFYFCNPLKFIFEIFNGLVIRKLKKQNQI